jgi:hypothetical protein
MANYSRIAPRLGLATVTDSVKGHLMQSNISNYSPTAVCGNLIDQMVGNSRLVPLDVGCAMLGCTQAGMKRFIAEKRVPDGLVVYIGRDKKLNLEVLQKIVRGEARIITAREAHDRGYFHCRGVRAEYERSVAKEGAKAARAQAEAQLTQAK